MSAQYAPGDPVESVRYPRSSISGEVGATEQLHLLESAVDEIADFVLILDATPPSAEGPFVQYVNRSLAHALGKTSADLVGKSYSLLLGSDTDPAVRRSLSAGLERKVQIGNELKLLRSDGSTFWVEFEATPLCDDSGDLRNWIAVGRDMTVRRRAQDQMSALVNAIDAARDGIEIYEVLSGAFQVLFENEAASRRSPRTLERLLSDPEHSPAAESLRKRLLDGHPVRRRTQAQRRDGSEYWVEIDARPLVSLGGGIETIVCVERDISATVVRERKLERENELSSAFRNALLRMFAATRYEDLYSHFGQAVAETTGAARVGETTDSETIPTGARAIEVPQGRYALRVDGESTATETERLDVLAAGFIAAARLLAGESGRS